MEKKKYYRAEFDEIKDKFVIVEKSLCQRQRNCFLSYDEAKAHFEIAEKIAIEKHEKIVTEIQELRQKLGIEFRHDYSYTGDSYGIDTEGLYIVFDVNGYEFWFKQ